MFQRSGSAATVASAPAGAAPDAPRTEPSGGEPRFSLVRVKAAHRRHGCERIPRSRAVIAPPVGPTTPPSSAPPPLTHFNRAWNRITHPAANSPVGVQSGCTSEMTRDDDTALIAGQLADLTHKVEEIEKQLATVLSRTEGLLELADTQQERIDIAARELAEVSERLQAAANALRQQQV
jgi:hypothetical protein